jgi:hypothetical protein
MDAVSSPCYTSNVSHVMKRSITILVIGIILGVLVAWFVRPVLERAEERKIVRQAIEEFGLPSLPLNSTVTYAYHNDQIVLEWYSFEFQTTREQASKWKKEADELNQKKMLGDGHIDFVCVLRNGDHVEVRLYGAYK